MDTQPMFITCSKDYCYDFVAKKEGSTLCSRHQREMLKKSLNEPIRALINKQKSMARENSMRAKMLEKETARLQKLEILQEEAIMKSQELSARYAELGKSRQELANKLKEFQNFDF